jgi:hypothetical protein
VQTRLRTRRSKASRVTAKASSFSSLPSPSKCAIVVTGASADKFDGTLRLSSARQFTQPSRFRAGHQLTSTRTTGCSRSIRATRP